jgi:ATP-dependent RNA helicase DDX24/MAK5
MSQSIDRFRASENGILIATDLVARGIDIKNVRTIIHYKLPHSAEVYVHRCGRTARAFADGCSIALIEPNETSKFYTLCKSFSMVYIYLHSQTKALISSKVSLS